MFFVDLKDYSIYMKFRIFLLFLTFYGLSAGSAFAQGKLIMLNGNEKRFITAELKGEVIVYQPENKDTSTLRKIDKFDVFSILNDNGTEEIIYNPDTVSGEDPTVSEARDYIKGERYAGLVYKNPLNLVSGVVVGGAGSVIGFYGLIVPVIYPAVYGKFTPKLKQPLKLNYNASTGKFESLPAPGALSNVIVTESFSAGYGKKARNMKIKNSLIGGGLGFAVGIAVLVLVLGD